MHDLCKLGATSIEILDFTFKVLKAKMSIYLNGGIHKKNPYLWGGGLTWSTSPWVIGWVWKRALALRWRVSERGPFADWPEGCDKRLNKAIFSARLSADRSGSSGPKPSSPATASFETSSFSCSWWADPCADEACKLGGELHVVYAIIKHYTQRPVQPLTKLYTKRFLNNYSKYSIV